MSGSTMAAELELVGEIVSVEQPVGGLPGSLAEQVYTLPTDLPFDDWQAAGLSLRFMHRNINFWVGDWLIYGAATYGEDAYQATLASISALLGREADSLGQCAWVASRFPPGTRVPGLSWSHHRAVLLEGLRAEDGRALLLDAVAEGWSVAELSDRAAARVAVIDARAAETASMPADADPAEDTTPAWEPSAADLTPDARQAMQFHADRLRISPKQAGRVWAAALVWAGVRDAFVTWEAD